MSDSQAQVVEATYEGKTLRFHQPLSLDEQQQVWVFVVPSPGPQTRPREAPSPDEILRLAAQVYEGLSPDEVDEIERIALDRNRFFLERN